MAYLHWKERFEQVKEIPLWTLLEMLGHRPVRERHGEQWYRSPFREENDASFKLSADGRLWYDFGEGVGGDIINFVCKYHDMSRGEALRELERLYGTLSDAGVSPSPPRFMGTAAGKEQRATPEMDIIGIKPVTSWGLQGYLRERGIPLEVAKPYVQELHYRRNDRPYFALAFANDSGGYELRNPWFKGTYGSKDISLIRPRPEAIRAVALFEGFMDFLSAIVVAERSPQMPVIVMNSVAMQERTLDTIQELGVETAYLYLDHDEAGRRLTQVFQERLPGMAILDRSEMYAEHTDLNDWLVARKAIVIG